MNINDLDRYWEETGRNMGSDEVYDSHDLELIRKHLISALEDLGKKSTYSRHPVKIGVRTRY